MVQASPGFSYINVVTKAEAQWSLYLAQFNFLLHHKPGKSMGKLDALSQRTDHGTSEGDNSDITLLTPKFFTVHALEGLKVASAEVDILQDICAGSRDPQEEPVAKAVKELWKSSTHSVLSQAWSIQEGLLYFCSHIYVPPTSDLCRRIVSLCHDTRIAGHAGWFKTLELVSRNYWWLNMSRYVGRYMATCDPCLWTKVQHQWPTGELQLFPVPEECWEVMSVDFIVELLESGGYDMIMVVIDSVSKRAHFMEMVTTITTASTANLYLQHVWKHHASPARSFQTEVPSSSLHL